MFPRKLGFLAVVAVACVLIVGCGSKESTEPDVLVTLAPDSTGVDLCGSVDIVAEVENAEDTRIDWYVNDVLGGNATIGTITQTNPAIYTAPRVMPDPPDVAIKAVPKADPSQEALCVVTLTSVAITKIYVNVSTGSDAAGTGCPTRPFKSIAHALQVAEAGMTVQVAPGVYDAANGEVFPIVLRDGISLVGEDWQATIIRGHYEDELYPSTVAIRGSSCVIRKLTLEGGPVVSRQWFTGIQIDSSSHSALIDSIRCAESTEGAVVNVDFSSNTTVSHCYFVLPGSAHIGDGFRVWDNNGDITISGCTIRGYERGIVTGGLSDVLIEGCTIEDIDYGVDICCWNVPESSANPDLGGGARAGAGGNVIRNYATCAIYNVTSNAIYAKFNTWQNSPPTEGVDFRNLGDGSVIWE